MDYRALAELVTMALLGLSGLVLALGFSVKFFLAPVLRDLFAKGRGQADLPPGAAAARLAQMEDRLDGIERELGRLVEAERFDRQLSGPDAS